MTSWPSALIAFLLITPALVFLPSVIFHIQPIQDALVPLLTIDGQQLNIFGRIFVYGGLFAAPIALVIALTPFIRKDIDGKRHLPWANAVVALLALALILPVGYEFGKDFYKCDILKIPNCD